MREAYIPNPTYVFKHALTQEVVYSSILKDRTKKYHEKIAQAMESMYADRLDEFYETLAYQYSQSESHQKTYEYLKQAGDKAFKNYANLEAYNYYKEALNTLDRLPNTEENKRKRLDTCKSTIGPTVWLSFPEESLQIMLYGERLSKELQDTKSYEFFCSFISNYYFFKGRTLEGVKYVEPRFFEAQKNNEIELTAQLAISLCWSYFGSGDLLKAIDIAPDVISMIEKENKKQAYIAGQFLAYSHLCYIYAYCLSCVGNFSKSKSLMEQALYVGKQLKDPISIGYIEIGLSFFYCNKGNGEKIVEHSRNAIKYFSDGFFPFLIGMSWWNTGYGYCLMGDLKSGIQCLEKGYSIQTNNPVSFLIPYYYLYLSFAHHDLAEYAKAQSNINQALELTKKHNDRLMEGQSRIWLGRISGKINPLNLPMLKNIFFRASRY